MSGSGYKSPSPRKVWFHRGYTGLTGGQLKHSHYYEHVRRMPGFAPRITFSRKPKNAHQSRERRMLWPDEDERTRAEHWEPGDRDVLFVAGVDWRYLIEGGWGALSIPRINLIQHVRHAHEGTELHGYLCERAVRICVSQEVADAIGATGRTQGPILTIPNGVDMAPFKLDAQGAPKGYDARARPIVIVGYKNPDLARDLSERLDAQSIEHLLLTKFAERDVFLALLSQSQIAVCLPHPEEGFYLPAIEAMASGCVVVTLDCVGNRGFCHHEKNCLLAEPCPRIPVQDDEESARPAGCGPRAAASVGPGHCRPARTRRGEGALSCCPGTHRSLLAHGLIGVARRLCRTGAPHVRSERTTGRSFSPAATGSAGAG